MTVLFLCYLKDVTILTWMENITRDKWRPPCSLTVFSGQHWLRNGRLFTQGTGSIVRCLEVSTYLLCFCQPNVSPCLLPSHIIFISFPPTALLYLYYSISVRSFPQNGALDIIFFIKHALIIRPFDSFKE